MIRLPEWCLSERDGRFNDGSRAQHRSETSSAILHPEYDTGGGRWCSREMLSRDPVLKWGPVEVGQCAVPFSLRVDGWSAVVLRRPPNHATACSPSSWCQCPNASCAKTHPGFGFGVACRPRFLSHAGSSPLCGQPLLAPSLGDSPCDCPTGESG